jgi:hypothetical protein
MSWSPTLFSGSGPVELQPVPWIEKTIEREVGRGKDLSGHLYTYYQNTHTIVKTPTHYKTHTYTHTRHKTHTYTRKNVKNESSDVTGNQRMPQKLHTIKIYIDINPIASLLSPNFVHYNRVHKKKVNFCSVAFRHLLMPFSGSQSPLNESRERLH